MTREDIENTLVGTTSWKAATPHQRNAFAKEMEIRQYGWDALTQAWGWFLTGWNSYKE